MITVQPKNRIKGLFSVPGDKSVSHRAVMLASIADGDTQIEGLLMGDDCVSTINCLRALGVEIDVSDKLVTVCGHGLYGLQPPNKPLDCGNSGTTMRLLSGILAAQPFESVLTGDASLKSRPMKRIIEPLEQMGAKIVSEGGFAPLTIKGDPSLTNLSPINYRTKTASAQVKSCVLLAGLYANGETTVTEPAKSRDHTEIMLKYLGANIKQQGTSVTVTGTETLNMRPIHVCGDISSAAYLIVAALILENSEVTITNVGVNSTRAGIISVLCDMGADIQIVNKRFLCGEAVADIKVKTGETVNLSGIQIGGDIIPTLIDEIPILAAAAVFANGTSVIKDAAELKIKESDRITAICEEFAKLGAIITPTEDGLIIEGNGGGARLHGGKADSRGDHRIAMSLAVLALKASAETTIIGGECASVSFPDFYELLNKEV